jgi:hypothetical protein
MPTRKVADLPPGRVCRSPEHHAPSMRVYPPGVYEHECPLCHKIERFTVEEPFLLRGRGGTLVAGCSPAAKK